jgi:hypothetical protein
MRPWVVMVVALVGWLGVHAPSLAAGEVAGDWPEPWIGTLRIQVFAVGGSSTDSLRIQVKDPRGRVWKWWEPDSITTEIPGSNHHEPFVFRGGVVPPQLVFQNDAPLPGTYRVCVEALGAVCVAVMAESRARSEYSQHSDTVRLRRGEAASWTVQWRKRPGRGSLMFSLQPRRLSR